MTDINSRIMIAINASLITLLHAHLKTKWNTVDRATEICNRLNSKHPEHSTILSAFTCSFLALIILRNEDDYS